MRWKPKIEPFLWLVGLLSAHCTHQSMRFWPKIGEWGDTCGGRRWKKYHPRQIIGACGDVEAAHARRGLALWLIHRHTLKRQKTAIYGHFWPALTALYYTPYYTESQHMSRKRGGSTEAGSAGRILFYAKYYTTQSICKSRHPHQTAPDGPGAGHVWIVA